MGLEHLGGLCITSTQPASRRQHWNALLSRGGAGESLGRLLVQGLS